MKSVETDCMKLLKNITALKENKIYPYKKWAEIYILTKDTQWR